MESTLTEDTNGKTRSWLGVCNNWTEEDYSQLSGAECTYKIIGKENAPTTGTPHLQMYFYFKTEKSFKQMKELNKRTKWIVAEGDSYANYKYCIKDGDFMETGKRPMTQREKGIKGKEALQLAWDLAKVGKIEEIDIGLRTRYYSTYCKIESKYQKRPEDIGVLNNYWFHGPPDTFKSKLARWEFPDIYDKQLTKWWDLYEGESHVLLDDFDENHVWMYSHLKRWADHYAFNGEVKQRSRWVRPKMIIVTSNYTIDQLWQSPITRHAIHRRFKEIEFKKGDYKLEDFCNPKPLGTDSSFETLPQGL